MILGINWISLTEVSISRKNDAWEVKTSEPAISVTPEAIYFFFESTESEFSVAEEKEQRNHPDLTRIAAIIDEENDLTKT